MAQFAVGIAYQGNLNYIVEAESKEEAEEIAKVKWHAGEKPDDCGNESETIDKVSVEKI